MQTIARDQTLALMREGYAFVPNRRRRLGADAFRTRLLAQQAVCVCGVEATRRFYDGELFRRSDAVPGPVQHTLTGVGAVHTLDDVAHQNRKAMFTSGLMGPADVQAVRERTAEEWDAAVRRWAQSEHVVLFDEAAEVLMRAVSTWAGVPPTVVDARTDAARMVAMVDGFGTAGPRHVRARRARHQAERKLERASAQARARSLPAPSGSMFERVVHHRDEHGDLLRDRIVAVEMLNVLRPTVATTWFLAFAAHALHRWPEHRERLASGDEAFAVAFAHEVRRFYPFGPFMGARARRDITWDDDVIAEGTLVLLDLFGQNHHEDLWERPYAFRPERFLDHPPGALDLVPQGGGDPHTGHRCPGEDIVVAVLSALVPRLARLRYGVPAQDLSISLARVPAKPASGVVLTGVSPPS